VRIRSALAAGGSLASGGVRIANFSSHAPQRKSSPRIALSTPEILPVVHTARQRCVYISLRAAIADPQVISIALMSRPARAAATAAGLMGLEVDRRDLVVPRATTKRSPALPTTLDQAIGSAAAIIREKCHDPQATE